MGNKLTVNICHWNRWCNNVRQLAHLSWHLTHTPFCLQFNAIYLAMTWNDILGCELNIELCISNVSIPMTLPPFSFLFSVYYAVLNRLKYLWFTDVHIDLIKIQTKSHLSHKYQFEFCFFAPVSYPLVSHSCDQYFRRIFQLDVIKLAR